MSNFVDYYMSLRPDFYQIKVDDKYGRHLVATRNIPAKTKVVLDFPTCVIVDCKPYNNPNWKLTEIILRDYPGLVPHLIKDYASQKLKSWDKIDDKDLNEIGKLFPLEKHKTVKSLYEVMVVNNINSIALGSGPELAHGFYPILSYANHSCNPNCVMFTTDSDTGLKVLVTRRDVKMGEQLTIPYVDLFKLNTNTRRMILSRHFEFFCNCLLCEKNS